MIIVVSDTSPIRALHHLDRLDVLQALFAEILIPPTVRNELENPPKNQLAVEVEKHKFMRLRLVEDRSSVERFLGDLDPGESEALALALAVHADYLLIDEAAGRAKAKEVGLVPLGTLGILIEAKRRGHIERLAPFLDQLQHEFRFFLSARVRSSPNRGAQGSR